MSRWYSGDRSRFPPSPAAVGLSFCCWGQCWASLKSTWQYPIVGDVLNWGVELKRNQQAETRAGHSLLQACRSLSRAEGIDQVRPENRPYRGNLQGWGYWITWKSGKKIGKLRREEWHNLIWTYKVIFWQLWGARLLQRGEAVDIEKCKGSAEDAGMFWNLGSMEWD